MSNFHHIPFFVPSISGVCLQVIPVSVIQQTIPNAKPISINNSSYIFYLGPSGLKNNWILLYIKKN